jgi:uncharacterized OsmC-like protein
MVKSTAAYQGNKRCELVHAPSGTRIETDAPRDNQGRGERFSPSDLVAAALTSCILTTMALLAEREGWSLAGATAEVEKHMVLDPRRIGRLPVQVTLPEALTPDQRIRLERAALHCPVHRSLHPEIDAPIAFRYV